MNRRTFLGSVAALAVVPGMALAGYFDDLLVVQLRDQGFKIVRIRKTWLGRIRILAIRADLTHSDSF
jgi:hypothetical protein